MTAFPFIRIGGTLREAATILGEHWHQTLRRQAATTPPAPPWWKQRHAKRLINSIALHLHDLFSFMAKGAGVDENRLGDPLPPDMLQQTDSTGRLDGCTSFALSPGRTKDGTPLAGQTKDTPQIRSDLFQILAFEPTDAPHFLTLTYPGWLFGHGFVAGGCAIYRNQLYAGIPPEKNHTNTENKLSYHSFGLLALHCRTLQDLQNLVESVYISEAYHIILQDGRGDILGIESTGQGVHFLNPVGGVYAHANSVRANPLAADQDPGDAAFFTRDESRARQRRIDQLLEARHDWTVPDLFGVLADHHHAPRGICRHEAPAALTSAAVISDARNRRLWVTHGPPCSHPPRCYQLTASSRPPYERLFT